MLLMMEFYRFLGRIYFIPDEKKSPKHHLCIKFQNTSECQQWSTTTNTLLDSKIVIRV